MLYMSKSKEGLLRFPRSEDNIVLLLRDLNESDNCLIDLEQEVEEEEGEEEEEEEEESKIL